VADRAVRRKAWPRPAAAGAFMRRGRPHQNGGAAGGGVHHLHVVRRPLHRQPPVRRHPRRRHRRPRVQRCHLGGDEPPVGPLAPKTGSAHCVGTFPPCRRCCSGSASRHHPSRPSTAQRPLLRGSCGRPAASQQPMCGRRRSCSHPPGETSSAGRCSVQRRHAGGHQRGGIWMHSSGESRRHPPAWCSGTSPSAAPTGGDASRMALWRRRATGGAPRRASAPEAASPQQADAARRRRLVPRAAARCGRLR